HFDIFGVDVWVGWILWGGVALEGSLTVLFFVLRRGAQKPRYKLDYFSPVSFQTLAALAEVLVAGPDERISPEKTAQNADAYIVGFHAKRKWLIKVALLGLYLYPLLTIRPPLPL